MRKIKCYLSTGHVSSRIDGVIEVEDNATEEEIKAEFDEWVANNTDLGWIDDEAEGCE